MKNILNNLKFESSFIKFSRIYFLIIILMTSVLLINQNLSINNLKNAKDMFERTVMEVRNNGGNIEELLNSDYSVKEGVLEDGTVYNEIDNIVRYDYEQLQNQLLLNSPMHMIFNLLSLSCLVYFPIIASIFAIYMSSYDYKYNTLKSRLLIGDSTDIYFSKLLSTILTFVLSFLIALIIGAIISYLWTQNTLNSIPTELILKDKVTLIHNIKALLIGLFISIFFIIITFNLGIIVKKLSVSIGIFFTYHMVIPNLGKFDIKNLIMNLYDAYFQSNSNFINPSFIIMNNSMSFFLLIIIAITSIVIGYFKFFYSSKYTV